MLMKRNLKAFIVLAIWLCWTSMAADDTATLGFKKLSFNTIGDSYANFIQSLRTALASNGDKRYGIPELPDPSTVSEQNRYFYVQLTNYFGDSTNLACRRCHHISTGRFPRLIKSIFVLQGYSKNFWTGCTKINRRVRPRVLGTRRSHLRSKE